MNLNLSFIKRYADDTFLLFQSKDHIEKFRGYLNCQRPKIKFTLEIAKNNSISFLDIKVSRVNDSFSTNIYCKVTFSGVSPILKALFLYLRSRI